MLDRLRVPGVFLLRSVVAACLLSPHLAKGEERCSLRLLATLPVTYDLVTDQPIVTISGNGRLLTFAVSTTAGFSVISPALVIEFGLTKRRQAMEAEVRMGHVNLTSAAHIPMLHIGGISLGNADFFVGPTANGFLMRHDGVIGQDILHLFDVEYDLGHNTIKLFASDHCPGKVVYWRDGYGQARIVQNSLHLILFNAVVNGKTLLTQLDTSLAASSIPRDVARRELGLGAPGAIPVSLELGNVVLKHPDIRVDGEHPFNDNLDFDPGFALGLNHLRKFRVFVAWRDGLVYFIPLPLGTH